MSFQEHHIREILSAGEHAVDPRHEADFRALLQREKRRRRFFIFFVFAGAIAVAGLLLGPELFSSVRSTNKTPDKQLEAVPAFNSSKSALKEDTSPQISDADHGSGLSSTSVDLTTPQSESMTTGGSGEISQPQTVHPPRQTFSSSHTQQTSASEATSTPLSSDSQPVVLKTRLDQETSDLMSETSTPSFSEETALPSQDIGTSSDHVHQEFQNPIIPTEDAEPLTAISEANASAEIIPASASKPWKKWSLGVTGMWYPTGLTAGDDVPAGNGVQIGGFGTYQFAPTLFIRSDLGFGYLQEGFVYRKESVSQVFAFSAVTLYNSLEAEQLYAGYLSADLNWQTGKYMVYGGAEIQYVYGARGNVHKEDYPRDSPAPVPVSSRDVWVSIDDMQQWMLRAQLGVRYQIVPRVQLGASLRIPLMRELRLSSSAGDYQYQFISPGVAPALSLSYQLIQQ